MFDVVYYLVCLALAWLLAGSVLWMWRDPFTVTDAVLCGWIGRSNRLPPRGVLLVAHVVVIVMWPRVLDQSLQGRGH
jgi:hypothetical protein